MIFQRLKTWQAARCTAGICFLLAGCGDGSPPGPTYPDPVPVEGIVTLDGKPLENAFVNFIPTGKGMRTASGTTDAEGRFELETISGSDVLTGAIPGEYKVWISSLVKPDGTRVAFDLKKPPAMQLARESLPPKYSREADTLLLATVKSSGVEDLKFELTSQ